MSDKWCQCLDCEDDCEAMASGYCADCADVDETSGPCHSEDAA